MQNTGCTLCVIFRLWILEKREIVSPTCISKRKGTKLNIQNMWKSMLVLRCFHHDGNPGTRRPLCVKLIPSVKSRVYSCKQGLPRLRPGPSLHVCIRSFCIGPTGSFWRRREWTFTLQKKNGFEWLGSVNRSWKKLRVRKGDVQQWSKIRSDRVAWQMQNKNLKSKSFVWGFWKGWVTRLANTWQTWPRHRRWEALSN